MLTESLTQMSLANRKCFDEKYKNECSLHRGRINQFDSDLRTQREKKVSSLDKISYESSKIA